MVSRCRILRKKRKREKIKNLTRRAPFALFLIKVLPTKIALSPLVARSGSQKLVDIFRRHHFIITCALKCGTVRHDWGLLILIWLILRPNLLFVLLDSSGYQLKFRLFLLTAMPHVHFSQILWWYEGYKRIFQEIWLVHLIFQYIEHLSTEANYLLYSRKNC